MKTKYISLFVIALLSLDLSAQTFPVIEKYKLKNGMEVIFAEYGTLPATSLSFYINVGKENETPGQQALADITANALQFGSQAYDRITQDNMLNEMGGQFDVATNENYTRVSFMFPNDETGKAVELVSNILLKPQFPKEDIQQYVGQLLNYNNPAKMDITALASVLSNHFVFGTAHPLGRYFYAAQLGKLTPAQVKEFYDFNYTPKNTKLVISGKPDKEAVKKLVEQYFGGWTAQYGENNRSVYEVAPINKKEYAFVNKPKASQAALRWTKKAPGAGSKDALPFRLAVSVFNTVLFDEIRAKEGKTYGIYCSYNEGSNTGIYSIATQVRNEVMHGTVQSLERVMRDFSDKGITEEKLKVAKAILKSYLLSIEDPEAFASFINPLLYDYNKRKEYVAEIEKMDLATVNKEIKKYFTPDAYKLVIAGDEIALADQLGKISGLQKLSIKQLEVDQ